MSVVMLVTSPGIIITIRMIIAAMKITMESDMLMPLEILRPFFSVLHFAVNSLSNSFWKRLTRGLSRYAIANP